ncbi:MAG TPA: Lrp/AsnC family transcriptional regulator [Pyrinomonadaceae bacterium]|nr:Lrp/AsnC family transcriptional regulator [Pyrinomonadaceae bacterium]
MTDVLTRAIAELRQISASGADFTAQVSAVRKAIEQEGCTTVAEIVEEANLSPWAVRKAIKKLLEVGAIVESEGFQLDAEESGRPPVEYYPAHLPRREDFVHHHLKRAAEDNLL